jgi:hypothetical protein
VATVSTKPSFECSLNVYPPGAILARGATEPSPHFCLASATTTTSHGDVWLHSWRQNVAIQAVGRRISR